MSVFDYPRINFAGTIRVNPATANNCDYAAGAVLPDGPGAGLPLALIDSKMVRAITYGMSDDEFRAWVQKAHVFEKPDKSGPTSPIIPAEWNFYGDLSTDFVDTTVVGVTTAAGETYTEPESGVALTGLIGAEVSTSGGRLTDVNSEGSPPATQFFFDALTVSKDGNPFLRGTPSKGACAWLNFYRNVNLTADGGAGGYVYHVIRKSDPGTSFDLPGVDDSLITGFIFRYCLFGLQLGAASNDAIEALYEMQQTNAATAQIVGTLAPLYEREHVVTAPAGRLLVASQTRIKTPGQHNNGNPGPPDSGYNLIALAPAVVRQAGILVSADFIGTFPDDFQPGPPATNPKFDFGAVSLMARSGDDLAVIGEVAYADTARGDGQGWVFDFDISANTAAQAVLARPDARFALVSSAFEGVALLDETDYYVVSNQQAVYGEQHGSGSAFLNQGTTEPLSVSVFHRGKELAAGDCPAITVWQYASVPLQDPGDAVAISTNHAPGAPIIVDTGQPGDFLFTFSVAGSDDPLPPMSYSDYMNPPFLTNAPSISLRILPNDEDFSPYFLDPQAPDPVGNDTLTFDVLYEKVLRTYYLLYPVMDRIVPLNSESAVTGSALSILTNTEPSKWMNSGFMPVTRDLSASRLQLLQAFCRKVLAQ